MTYSQFLYLYFLYKNYEFLWYGYKGVAILLKLINKKEENKEELEADFVFVEKEESEDKIQG